MFRHEWEGEMCTFSYVQVTCDIIGHLDCDYYKQLRCNITYIQAKINLAVLLRKLLKLFNVLK
jgi:hypothetical protein